MSKTYLNLNLNPDATHCSRNKFGSIDTKPPQTGGSLETAQFLTSHLFRLPPNEMGGTGG
jgi:hypothetical protein